MRILFSSDLHGNIPLYEELWRLAKEEAADVILLGGDLFSLTQPFYRRIQEQIEFARSYLKPALGAFRSRHPEKTVFLLHGNTDWMTAVAVLNELAHEGLVRLLHGRIHPLGESHWIVGYAHVPPTPFLMKDFERLDLRNAPVPGQRMTSYRSDGPKIVVVDAEDHFRSHPSIEEELETLPRPPSLSRTLYVFHSPPFGTGLDLTRSGEAVGSRAIRDFIERHQPSVTLHGHVHEAPEMTGTYADHIGNTLCVNPGQSPSILHAVVFDLDDLPGSLRHTVYGRYNSSNRVPRTPG